MNQHVRELPARACVTDAVYVDKGTNALIGLLIFIILKNFRARPTPSFFLDPPLITSRSGEQLTEELVRPREREREREREKERERERGGGIKFM